MITNFRSEEMENQEGAKEEVLIGKAISYGEKTKLFSIGGKDYFEIIERGALDGADMKDFYAMYNHDNDVFARNKNGTLEIKDEMDGAYAYIKPINTTAGNDVRIKVRTGTIDKMSFGFSIAEESYNEEERTWTVRKIKRLYEVSAVPFPAYEGTSLHARRANEVESRLAELENSKKEALKTKARALIELNKIKN